MAQEIEGFGNFFHFTVTVYECRSGAPLPLFVVPGTEVVSRLKRNGVMVHLWYLLAIYVSQIFPGMNDV